MPKVIILGCGASAYIVKSLYPESIIIGKASLTPTFSLGLHYIHNKNVARLFPSEPLFITTVIDGQEATEETILKYKKKIYGESNRRYNNKPHQFEYCSVGYKFDIDKSFRPDIEGKVKSVNIKDKVVLLEGNGVSEISYDILINTIPLNIFEFLLEEDRRWSKDETYQFSPICVHIEQHPHISPMRIGNLVVNYLSNPVTPIYREVTCYHRNIVTYQSEHILTDNCRNSWTKAVINPGKLLNSGNYEYFVSILRNRNIYCLGRFAQWDNKIMLEDVYNDAVEILLDNRITN